MIKNFDDFIIETDKKDPDGTFAYVKAKAIMIHEFENLKYIYMDIAIGAIGKCLRSGMIMSQEIIEAFKDALIETFFAGCEPDFENAEVSKWWENLTPETLKDLPNKKVKLQESELNEGQNEIHLTQEKEKQAKINNAIAELQKQMFAVDKMKKSETDRIQLKAKLLVSVAQKTADLARSMNTEAKLMFAFAGDKKKAATTQTSAPVSPTSPTL